MRYILVLFILYFFNLAAYAQPKFESSNHYSFEVPSRWAAIPSPLLAAKLKDMKLQDNSYEAAFQLLANNQSDILKYPYVLVQFFPARQDMDTIPFERLVLQTAKSLREELANYDPSKVDSGKVLLISAADPVVDSANRCISRKLVVRVSLKENVQCIKRICFGRFGIVTLQSFVLSDGPDADKKDVDRLFASFSFADQYQKAHVKAGSPGSSKRWGWWKLAVALGISVVVFFIVKNFSK